MILHDSFLFYPVYNHFTGISCVQTMWFKVLAASGKIRGRVDKVTIFPHSMKQILGKYYTILNFGICGTEAHTIYPASPLAMKYQDFLSMSQSTRMQNPGFRVTFPHQVN